MKLPERVKVNGFWFSIEKDNEMLLARNALGRTEHDNQKIKIDDSVSPNSIRTTLLHEVIHVIDASLSEEHNMQELQVKILARGLFQVFTENPEVRKFIFEN